MFEVRLGAHPSVPIAADPLRLEQVFLNLLSKVDDEPDVLEIMKLALEGAGATVFTASNARGAIDLLSRSEVDVLMADIAMPGEDGYDLIRTVRALPASRAANIPATAVTACARDDERQRALAAGFQVHLPKPLNPAQLVHTVASLTGVSAGC